MMVRAGLAAPWVGRTLPSTMNRLGTPNTRWSASTTPSWGAQRTRDLLGSPTTVLLGVDRLDYTKGILQRLKAFEELLARGDLDPNRTVLVQVAVP